MVIQIREKEKKDMKDIFKSKETFKEAWINYVMENGYIKDINYLNNVFESTYKNKNVQIYNSAKGISKYVDSLQLLDTAMHKYVLVENGVLFVNHDIFTAPVVDTYSIFKSNRSNNKKLMRQAQMNEDPIKENFYNNMQGDDKTNQNTLYGTQLNIYSKYYNYDVAGAITVRGRSTVSMNGLTIESAFGDYRPYSVEPHIRFISECKRKDIQKYTEYLKVPTDDEILRHLLHYHYDGYYGKDLLRDIIINLSNEDKKKVYYTSNFEGITSIPRVKWLFSNIIRNQNENYHYINDLENDPEKYKKYKDYLYLDPMECPEGIKEWIDEYTDIVGVLLAGFYWYEGDYDKSNNYKVSTQEIFKSIERMKILITDTDSLIIYLYISMLKIIKSIDNFEEITDKIEDADMMNYIIGSIIIATISKIIDVGLARYTEASLIPERYRSIISYKQEFVFRTLQVTKGAKNYLGMIRVQEGVYFGQERSEVKGLSLKKSNFNKKLSDVAKHIAVDMIAKEKNPDINAVLKEIEKSRKEILELYKSKDNIELFTVNKIKEPYGQMNESDYRMKAVRLYNSLYNTEISLPGSFLITNIKFTGREEDLKEDYPEKYEIIKENMRLRTIYSNKRSLKNKIDALELTEEEQKKYYDFLNSLDNAKDYEDMRDNYIKPLKKDDFFNRILKDYAYKNVKIEDITKIAIPLDSESVDDFITEYIDSDDIAVFENLAAVIIQGIGMEVVKNAKNRQLLTNIVSYY